MRVSTLVIALGGALVGSAVAMWLMSDPGCANPERQRVRSPNGRHDLVVYDRDCGATTDYSTQVSVLPRGATARGRGNAYVNDHVVPLTVAWTSDTGAAIRYPPGLRGLKEARRVGGVGVRYAEDSTVRDP
jgi:hypothetical protein